MKRETASPLIACPTCNGRGKTPLVPHLRKVYGFVNNTTAVEVYQQLIEKPRTVTAINNALEHLRSLKLVKRRWDSGEWRYSKV